MGFWLLRSGARQISADKLIGLCPRCNNSRFRTLPFYLVVSMWPLLDFHHIQFFKHHKAAVAKQIHL